METNRKVGLAFVQICVPIWAVYRVAALKSYTDVFIFKCVSTQKKINLTLPKFSTAHWLANTVCQNSIKPTCAIIRKTFTEAVVGNEVIWNSFGRNCSGNVARCHKVSSWDGRELSWNTCMCWPFIQSCMLRSNFVRTLNYCYKFLTVLITMESYDWSASDGCFWLYSPLLAVVCICEYK